MPDAYRCKFRELKKNPDVSHLEFARLTREALTRWLRAMNVQSYEGLMELFLLEKFVTTVSHDVGVHVVEREVETIEEAARLADKYVLAHGTFKHSSGTGTGTDKGKNAQGIWHNKKTSTKGG